MPPRVVDFDQAADVIRTLAVSRAADRHPVVGITGPVGAGKSTLAAMLAGAGHACVLSTDHYLPDYDATPEHLRDLPESADLARLLADLSVLRSGRRARVPVWSFHEHRRVGEADLDPPPAQGPTRGLILVEGLHALHHASALDVAVYIDAPAGERLRRMEERERSGQRGWGVEVARAFFHAVAEPTFARRAATYQAAADVLVRNA